MADNKKPTWLMGEPHIYKTSWLENEETSQIWCYSDSKSFPKHLATGLFSRTS